MKSLFAFVLSIVCMPLGAQTVVEKSVPVRPGQKLSLDFEWAEIIKVTTWDQPQASIKVSVSINRGENDDAFMLESKAEGSTVIVSSAIRDEDKIPERIVIKHGDVEYYFKTGNYNDPEIQKFLEEKGREYRYMSHGVIKDINYEVKVPRGIETEVNTKYGLVEVESFASTLTVNANFGGVDATIDPARVGQLTARYCFGEVLTNLDLTFSTGRESEHPGKWSEITAKAGSGPSYRFESKFGKIYLRKPD
jgi:hypothetical protein